jgi:peptide/nickel transport system permease protein
MLWAIVTLVFLLLRATHGDPADAILGARAPESAKESLRQSLGLNVPLWQQYILYLGNLLKFNFGTSLINKERSVWQIIFEHFPATAELAFFSLLVAVVVGISIGVYAATHPNTFLGVGGRLFSIVTYSLPIFWVGMLFQLIFAVQLNWFPLGTRFPISQTPPATITGLYTLDSLIGGNFAQFSTALYYLTLPSLTLGLLLSGIFERMVRVNLQKTLKSDYVEAAKARGIQESEILWIHAFKNALIPVITVLGLTFASLLGGAVLTEVTFSWPGLGNRLYEAISLRDYPTVQGILIFFGFIVIISSVLIDIINALIDPRIRY